MRTAGAAERKAAFLSISVSTRAITESHFPLCLFIIEQAAGITNGQQVYDFIMAGSEAAGAASGIINAEDPIAMVDEMVAAVRRAADDLKKAGG